MNGEASRAVASDPVARLRLSVRARNYLRRLRLRNIEELVKLVATGLPAVPGYGRHTRSEVLAVVRALNRGAPTAEGTSQISLFEHLGPEFSGLQRPSPIQAQFLRQPGELGLSSRAVNVLSESGVHLVGDLVELSEAKLRRLRGLGRKSVAEILSALAEVGLQLGMQIEGWPPDDLLECRARHASTLAAIRAESFTALLPRAAAARHTLEDEYEAIGGLAASERDRSIVLQYLGVGLPELPTLEQVGMQHNLTRERVRQVVAQVVRGLQLRVLRPPRLLEAARLLRQSIPITSKSARELLVRAGLSRGGVSAESVVRTLSALTNRQPFLRGFQLGGSCVLVDSRSANWLRRVLHQAQRRIRRRGVARVSELTSWLASSWGRPANEDVIRYVIEANPGVVWLDETNDWFTIFGLPRNRLLNIIRKVLAVAGTVEVRTLREGIQRQFHMRGFAPPTRVLERLADELPWCVRTGQSIGLNPGVALPNGPGSITEQALVRVLRQHGPVMSGHRLVAEAVRDGAGEVAVNAALCYSPILQRVAFGLYALRGEKLDPGVVAQAIESIGSKSRRLIDFGWSRNRTLWLAMTLSRSTVRTGIFWVPAGLRRQLKESYLCRMGSAVTRETMKLKRYQAWGMRRAIVAADAQPDDVVLLVFDNRAGTVDVSFGTDSKIWERLRERGAYTG
jgi:hypothetical protein